MSADINIFKDFDINYMSMVKIANREFVEVEGRRDIEVEIMAGTKTLNNVSYVPKIKQNLVSVEQLLEDDYSLSFNKGICKIRDCQGTLLLSAKIMNRSFNLDWKEAFMSMSINVSINYIL